MAAAEIASNGVTSTPARAGLDDEPERAEREHDQVQEDKDRNRPKRALVDHAPVQANGTNRLPVDCLVELPAEDAPESRGCEPTLMAPAVDPAEPPMNMSATSVMAVSDRP